MMTLSKQKSPVDTLFKVKLIALIFSYPTDAGIA